MSTSQREEDSSSRYNNTQRIKKFDDGLEYFKGITIGNTTDWDNFTLAVYEQGDTEIERNIPQDCALAKLKQRVPLLVISITMYNESFDQFLQTFASVVRHVAEMYKID